MTCSQTQQRVNSLTKLNCKSTVERVDEEVDETEYVAQHEIDVFLFLTLECFNTLVFSL